MKHLTKFDSIQEYNEYINSPNCAMPNVTYLVSSDRYMYASETRVVVKVDIPQSYFDGSDTATLPIVGFQSEPERGTRSNGTYFTDSFSNVEIDGEDQLGVPTTYTFTTAGEHILKYTLADRTQLKPNALVGCLASEIYLPHGLVTIGEGSLSVGNLTDNGEGTVKCNIPITVKSLGSLPPFVSDVIIPENVENIDGFGVLPNSFTCLAKVPPVLGSLSMERHQDGIIFVPEESVDIYRTAPVWSDYSDYIWQIGYDGPVNPPQIEEPSIQR